MLGALVSGKKAFTAVQLSEIKELALADWTRYAMISKETTAADAVRIFREALSVSVLRSSADMSETELEFVNTHPEFNETFRSTLETEIAKIGDAEVKDMVTTVINVVCNSRFYYTDAGTILKAINSVSENNAGTDVREAALIATIQYVADYVADQMKVTTEIL